MSVIRWDLEEEEYDWYEANCGIIAPDDFRVVLVMYIGTTVSRFRRIEIIFEEDCGYRELVVSGLRCSDGNWST